MPEGRPLHAFEGCGIEIEYALVDSTTLDIAPLADAVLQRASGSEQPVNDYSRGALGWSNELVLHVLELKNLVPDADLAGLARRFQDEVASMNHALQAHAARLMPGGMHPWMNPQRDTRLWLHDHAHVYATYDRIFGCRSHGWANLQATHINLPYAGNDEFARLHAILRIIVPILPALTAASPYTEGRASGRLDQRMEAYRRNAEAVPEMNGEIVPDIVASPDDYQRRILQPLYRAIAPHDPEGVLQYDWLNARGVIPRFERSALEIRVLDTQECPYMDMAYAALVMDLAQSLWEREFARVTPEAQLPTRVLAEVFLRCVAEAEKAQIESRELLQCFGLRRGACPAAALWEHIAERLDRENSPRTGVWRRALEFSLLRGPLARRLLRAVGPRPSHGALHELYAALCDALEHGDPFDP